jgi:hypothetical protein
MFCWLQLHFHIVPALNLAELSKEVWCVTPYQMLSGQCHFGGITHLWNVSSYLPLTECQMSSILERLANFITHSLRNHALACWDWGHLSFCSLSSHAVFFFLTCLQNINYTLTFNSLTLNLLWFCTVWCEYINFENVVPIVIINSKVISE